MAAIEEPGTHVLTIRDAAEACGLSTRTIRRRLASGAFPRAFKLAVTDSAGEGVWRIPIADLYRSGLVAAKLPLAAAPGGAAARQLRTNSQLVSSDRFGRLRSELAAGDRAAVPSSVRDEALRYTTLIQAARQARTSRRWWHRSR